MYSSLKNREGIKETRPIKLWQRLLRLLLETGSSPLMVSKVASSQRQRTINWSSLKPTAIQSPFPLSSNSA